MRSSFIYSSSAATSRSTRFLIDRWDFLDIFFFAGIVSITIGFGEVITANFLLRFDAFPFSPIKS
ncbi:MAG: hypothetical protein KAI43_07890 [Candidatus Aureabacteria bacterium]|nr:hypothetical protein [Candidatus Auribacterota bacterium]